MKCVRAPELELDRVAVAVRLGETKRRLDEILLTLRRHMQRHRQMILLTLRAAVHLYVPRETHFARSRNA